MSQSQMMTTGIPFLPRVPSNWGVLPLYCCFDENKTRNHNLEETQVLSLSYGKIIDRDIESNFGLLPESFDSYQVINEGYIVLRLTDLQNDQRSLRVGLSPKKGIITSAYVGLKPRQIIWARYGYYLLHTYDIKKVFYNLGAGVRQSLKYSELKRLPAVIPPLPIQKAIAAYLDKETARIDALIAKKERQIELLQEKRQAIITRAITKGLDLKAKMKDSGVEWIGEIPEGWEEIKGRFLFTFIGGGTPSTEEVTFWEGDIPWVSSKDMKKLFLEDTEDHINSIAVKNSSTNILPSNTLLLVMRSGILQHTIPVAIICKDMAVNQDIKGFLPKQTLNPIYFAYFIQGFQAQLLTEWRKEGATVESLDLDSIKNFIFPLPSLVEQNNIVKTIAIQLDAITNLGNSVLESISLLREYRSSLITAAVSGKLFIGDENDEY